MLGCLLNERCLRSESCLLSPVLCLRSSESCRSNPSESCLSSPESCLCSPKWPLPELG